MMINIFEYVICLFFLLLFLVLRRNVIFCNGEVFFKFFFFYVLVGIVVIFGVLFGEKVNRDEVFISKWVVIVFCICVGLLVVLFLFVLSCC